MGLNPFERSCLEPVSAAAAEADDAWAWLRLLFDVALEAGRIVRQLKGAALHDLVVFKADGSPFTIPEEAIEDLLRARLADSGLDAAVVGEESGGELPAKGYAVAIDPVDGTWSLIGRGAMHSVCLAVFLDSEPVAGLILNPSTGEVVYAGTGGPTRWIQLAALGLDHDARDLPFERADGSELLVSVHPSTRASGVIAKLHERWKNRDVRLVRSVGGSPSWALAAAAKGGFVYVNLWGKRPAQPYDLAAGILVVRAAGGDVVNLDGAPVPFVGHVGPLVAAVDGDARKRVLDIVRGALRE